MKNNISKPVTNPKKALGAVAKRFNVSKSDIREDFGGAGNFAQAALSSSGVTTDDIAKLQLVANQARLEDAERRAAQSIRVGMKFADGGKVASPTELSWNDAGAKHRAPASDPVTTFNTLNDQVADAAKQSRLPGLHNGPADAYRHALWTAAMTKKYGSNTARLVGLANEIYGAGRALANGERIRFEEIGMDLKNNETGIRLARETPDDQELWRRVRDLADRTTEPMSYGDAFALLTDDDLINLPPDSAYEPAVVAVADRAK